MNLREKRPSGPLFFVLAVIVAISGSAIGREGSSGTSPEIELHSWPAAVWSKLGEYASRGGVALTEALFDSLESIDLFSIKLRESERAKIHVEREVVDNFDALGTWTVIDRTQIRLDGNPLRTWTTLADDASTPVYGTPYASFIFEPQVGIEWANVRQVDGRAFPRRQHLEKLRRDRDRMRGELVRELESISNSKSVAEDPPEPDPDVTELNPFTPWYYVDPSIRARFSKILNFVTFPFKMPLSVKTLEKRMLDGEMISWGFFGKVEVGAEIGWKVVPDPTTEKAGISYRVTGVGRGNFRISVLRENKRYAKVKLSTMNAAGTRRNLSAGYRREDIMKGFWIVKGPDLEVNVFEIEDEKLNGNLFDIGYRYDLESDDGKEAYHRAVLGSFNLSEGFALRDMKSPTPAVQKIFERDATTDDRTRKTKSEIKLFFKKERLKKLGAIEARILLPDGEHHVFSSSAENQTKLRNWFGANSEKASRKLSVLLDEELYQKGDPNSLIIIGESSYEDSSTNGRELYWNVAEIENFLGKDLFPQISYTVPRRAGNPESRKMKRAWFGRSSFYWGFHARRPDIEFFLEASPENRRAWVNSLIPKNKREKVLRAWDAATEYHRNGDLQNLFHALKKLFEDRKITFDLMLLLRVSVPKPLNGFVTAANSSFGRIQESGKYQTSVARILTLTDQELGFEGYARRQRDDTEATLSDLRAEETDEGLIRVNFNLKEEAKTVYFRISRPKDFFGAKDTVEVMYANSKSGFFKKGANTILLDPLSDHDLLYRLSSPIRRDRRYFLQVAYSRDAKQFGSLVGTFFRAGVGYPRVRSNTE